MASTPKGSAIEKIIGWGYVALGGAFILKGIGVIKVDGQMDKGEPAALLGEGPEAKALRASGGVIKTSKIVPVRDIAARVAFIKTRIKEDSLKPAVREKALAVLTRKCSTVSGGKKWCVEPKDQEAEVTALFRATQDVNSDVALRYTRDHVEVDQFHAADKLIRLKGGDCDDGVILLGAMLRAVGYPIKLRVIQDTKSASWSHIYLLVGLPAQNPSKWIPLDWSVYPFKPAGWEAPGAADVALSGKPAGLVTRLRDFDV